MFSFFLLQLLFICFLVGIFLDFIRFVLLENGSEVHNVISVFLKKVELGLSTSLLFFGACVPFHLLGCVWLELTYLTRLLHLGHNIYAFTTNRRFILIDLIFLHLFHCKLHFTFCIFYPFFILFFFLWFVSNLQF